MHIAVEVTVYADMSFGVVGLMDWWMTF